MRMRWTVLSALALALTACGSSSAPGGAIPADASRDTLDGTTGMSDSGVDHVDSGSRVDSDAPVDSSGSDAVVSADGGLRMSGIDFPLYKYPDLSDPTGVWNGIINAKKAHPRVPFVVIINPASGPGTSADPNIVAAVAALKAAGIEHLVGYVPTDYGEQPAGETTADVEQMIDEYASWYTDLDGVMFDEMAGVTGDESFYQTLATYSRSHGLSFVTGNPGDAVPEGYISFMDNLNIYEDSGTPTISQLKNATMVPTNPRTEFTFVAHDTPSLDAAFVLQARTYVEYMFITDASEPNPYDVLPSYWDALVATLDM
jgi:hypothetical protein